MVSNGSEHLRRMLRDGESLRWRGKPSKRAHYLTNVLGGFVAGIFLTFFVVSFSAPFLAIGVHALAGAGMLDWIANLGPAGALAGAAGLALLVLGAILGLTLLVARLSYGHAEYAITEDRAVAFSGVIGRDFSTVDWTRVQDLEVDVGLLDKLFGTGTVRIKVAGAGDPTTGSGVSFRWIRNPYEVVNQLEPHRASATN